MSAKGAISNLCLRPTTGAPPRGASCVPPTKVVVNNRQLGSAGQMSQGFGTQSTVASRQSDKIKLNQLLAKASQAQYQVDPLASRNLQAQINQRAQNVYGGNRTKVALVNQTAQRLSGQDSSSGACRFVGGRNTHSMGGGGVQGCSAPTPNYQPPTTPAPANPAPMPTNTTSAPTTGAQRLAALIKQK